MLYPVGSRGGIVGHFIFTFYFYILSKLYYYSLYKTNSIKNFKKIKRWIYPRRDRDQWPVPICTYIAVKLSLYNLFSGPRKTENTHVPNRAGEDIEVVEPTSSFSCSIHGRHLAIVSTHTLLLTLSSTLLVCLPLVLWTFTIPYNHNNHYYYYYTSACPISLLTPPRGPS